MMEKTAMQGLMESFDDYERESHNDSIMIEKLKEVINHEYLKLEKQQMIDMHKDGQRFVLNDSDENIIEHASEEYFNTKYRKQ